MKKLYLLAIALLCLNALPAQVQKMAAIGSSTTGGTGAWPPDSSWLKRLNYHYKYVLGKLDTTYTHGVGGYSCYKGMPSSYTPPPDRPGPDPGNNISIALRELHNMDNPGNGVIIVNYPSNGYLTYSMEEIMQCLQTIYDSAVAAGHICYVTTTQPRTDGNFAEPENKRKLAVIKDSIINRFGEAHTLNFYDGMINPADSSIRADLAAGDNIHYNNAGHRELFQRVVAKDIFNLTPQAALPVTIEQFSAAIKNATVVLQWTAHHDDAHSYFVVQRSADGLHFESLTKLPVEKNGSAKNTYRYEDAQATGGHLYYRLEVHEAARLYYSSVVSVKIPVTELLAGNIYPTKVLHTLTLEIISAEPRRATLEIIGSNGMRLKTFLRELQRNKNIISLPVPELPAGSYFLRITCAGSAPLIRSFLK
jgi:hypothetical protein